MLRSILPRRRIVLKTTACATGLLVGLAGVTEYRANQREQRLLQLTGTSTTFFGTAESSTDDDSQHQDPIAMLPRTYDWDAVHTYWSHRPLTATIRLFEVTAHLLPRILSWTWDHSSETLPHHASALRRTLTHLGPAFVKLGQQLSIRPDLVPATMLPELRRLCDAVTPVDDAVMLERLRHELQVSDLLQIFEERPVRVASASLGQVYKATLLLQTKDHELEHTTATNQRAVAVAEPPPQSRVVAVKVQRPDMLRRFSLDLYLLQRFGLAVDRFTSTFTNQPPFHKALYESFSRGSYGELDYEQEAAHQLYFRHELTQRRNGLPVRIPHVYTQHTTRTVLTTEWINGVRLADCDPATIQSLIPVGVELFLTQLLDVGAFHADPHAGNLLVCTDTGANDGIQQRTHQLCLLDFGLVVHVTDADRQAMTKAIVHLLLRDFKTLVRHDAKELGFLPHDLDTRELEPLLTKILTVGLVESGSSLRRRQRQLGEISNELNEVFFQYPFTVPPFFALVTRGLGLLEGIALQGDPDFDIFQASAPYARRRAMQLLRLKDNGAAAAVKRSWFGRHSDVSATLEQASQV